MPRDHRMAQPGRLGRQGAVGHKFKSHTTPRKSSPQPLQDTRTLARVESASRSSTEKPWEEGLTRPSASCHPGGSHGVWLHKEDGVRSERGGTAQEEQGTEDEDEG